MALRGTLRDFGLSDIFQLISHQRKTGVLYLEDKGKSVSVTFDEGKVVGAEAVTEKTHEKERVGEILLKSGLIEISRLQECLREQQATAKKLGLVLTEKKYLTEELFKQALAFQIKETLFRIFQWTSGTYRFETGKVTYDKQFISPLPAEFILMEAARIIDEWPGVRARIPSLEIVFAKIPGAEDKVLRRSQIGSGSPEEAGELDFDILGEAKPKSYDADKTILTAEQERVFDLVNGQFNVSDIAYRSLLGDFESSKALLDLAGFGLVKPVKVPASTPKTEEVAEDTKRRKGLIAMVSGLLFAGILVFILFGALARSGGRLNILAQITSEKAGTIRETVVQSQKQRLMLALETYRLEKGSYPTALEDMVQSGLVLPSDITYPFNSPYTIEWTERGPVVISPAE
ncbi:MAG: DUF4388 domain-containing protein [bacterium]|nr:MAG: DUF4388 domain-containing protein [bacterium]